MIAWLIILSVLLLGVLGLSIYNFIQCRLNKKAILEVLAPKWESHEQTLLKILKKI